MATSKVARSGEGIFHRLANVIVRWPLLVIGVWIAFAVAPLLAFPPLAEITARQQVAQLPDDAAHAALWLPPPVNPPQMSSRVAVSPAAYRPGTSVEQS